MGCHSVIATDNPEVQKLAGYWERQEAIPWVRIYRLPRFTFFTHQVHVTAGLNCENCHGDVADMVTMEAVVDMSGGWCLGCHNQQPNATQLKDCVVCHRQEASMAHNISRRDLPKVGAAGAATAVLAGCQPYRPWVILEPHVRPPEQELAGVATWFASTCRQCPAGCGVVVRIMNGRALKIEGTAEHPLNRGKLCERGQAGLQALYNPDRLSGTVVQTQRGSRGYQAVPWAAGINELYERMRAAGDRLAVWLGSTASGHLADLFQWFNTSVGAPKPLVYDLYTNVNGYRILADVNQELFGRAALPTYNLSQADVIYSFGADFLGTWLSAVRYGVEFGGFRGQPLGKRGYLLQLEPRMSINGAMADRWLPIRAGSEGLVAAALLRIMADEGLSSKDRVEQALALAGDVDVGSVAAAVDISVEELAELARMFAAADRPVAVVGGAMTGMDGSRWAVDAVQVMNLVAGTAGQPGGRVVSTVTL